MKTSIKNWLISLSAIIVIFAISNVLASCSTAEETILKQPYLSQLNNTECISHPRTEALQSRADAGRGSFEMTFEDGTAKCKFTALDYPCDFDKVNIKVLYEDDVLTIVEFPSSDDADCRCETDASFTIMNTPEKDFILKIYHGNTAGKYNKDAPRYVGTIRVKDGSIIIPYWVEDHDLTKAYPDSPTFEPPPLCGEFEIRCTTDDGRTYYGMIQLSM